jgi:Tfp pilus assembly protein PilX
MIWTLGENMKQYAPTHTQGIALVTVLIMFVITISLVVVASLLAIGNRRSSADSVQTVKTQYAAEAGVEAALNKVFYGTESVMTALKNAGTLSSTYDMDTCTFKLLLTGVIGTDTTVAAPNKNNNESPKCQYAWATASVSKTNAAFPNLYDGATVTFTGSTDGVPYSVRVTRSDDATGSTISLTFDSTATITIGGKEAAVRRVQKKINIEGKPFPGDKFALLTNKVNCSFCHLQVDNMKRVFSTTAGQTFDRVLFGSLTTDQLQFRTTGHNSDTFITGTVYSRSATAPSNTGSQSFAAKWSATGGAGRVDQGVNANILGNFFTDTSGASTAANYAGNIDAALPATAATKNGKIYFNYPNSASIKNAPWSTKWPDEIVPDDFPTILPDPNKDRFISDSEWASYVSTAPSGTLTGGTIYGVARPNGGFLTTASVVPISYDPASLYPPVTSPALRAAALFNTTIEGQSVNATGFNLQTDLANFTVNTLTAGAQAGGMSAATFVSRWRGWLFQQALASPNNRDFLPTNPTANSFETQLSAIPGATVNVNAAAVNIAMAALPVAVPVGTRLLVGTGPQFVTVTANAAVGANAISVTYPVQATLGPVAISAGTILSVLRYATNNVIQNIGNVPVALNLNAVTTVAIPAGTPIQVIDATPAANTNRYLITTANTPVGANAMQVFYPTPGAGPAIIAIPVNTMLHPQYLIDPNIYNNVTGAIGGVSGVGSARNNFYLRFVPGATNTLALTFCSRIPCLMTNSSVTNTASISINLIQTDIFPSFSNIGSVNKTFNGNLIIDGGQINGSTPFTINGTISVNGDVVVRGRVNGQGRLVARGNVYVVGDLVYNCGTGSGRACKTSEYAAPESSGLGKLAVLAGGNVVVGDHDFPDFRSGRSQYELVNDQVGQNQRPSSGNMNPYNIPGSTGSNAGQDFGAPSTGLTAGASMGFVPQIAANANKTSLDDTSTQTKRYFQSQPFGFLVARAGFGAYESGNQFINNIGTATIIPLSPSNGPILTGFTNNTANGLFVTPANPLAGVTTQMQPGLGCSATTPLMPTSSQYSFGFQNLNFSYWCPPTPAAPAVAVPVIRTSVIATVGNPNALNTYWQPLSTQNMGVDSNRGLSTGWLAGLVALGPTGGGGAATTAGNPATGQFRQMGDLSQTRLLKLMWLITMESGRTMNDNGESPSATPNAQGQAPLRTDGIFYSPHGIWCVARYYRDVRGNSSAVPAPYLATESSTQGRWIHNGSVIAAELGFLLTGNLTNTTAQFTTNKTDAVDFSPAPNGGQKGPGMGIFYDDRLAGFLGVENTGKVRIRRVGGFTQSGR